MKRSCVPALIAACILAVPPLVLKVDHYSLLSRVDSSRETRLLDILRRDGFRTAIEHPTDTSFLIHAKRDACSMDLREVAPSGFDRAAMAAVAGDRDLYYVDAGTVSKNQPVWRTWIYFHYRRFVSFLGWSLPKRLTFAVTAAPSCDHIDWSELSKKKIPADPSASEVSRVRSRDSV